MQSFRSNTRFELTVHSEVAANAHPASAREGPEPSVPLSARLFGLPGPVKPPRMIPSEGLWVDASVAVEAVCCRAYAHPAWDLVGSELAGGVRGHPGLAPWDGSFESQRFHRHCVEDREAVQL